MGSSEGLSGAGPALVLGAGREGVSVAENGLPAVAGPGRPDGNRQADDQRRDGGRADRAGEKTDDRAEAMIERVAVQVIRVVAARLGSWAAVFIGVLLGCGGLLVLVSRVSGGKSRRGWVMSVAAVGGGVAAPSFSLPSRAGEEGGPWS